jgi:hypothetical protein
LGLESGKVCSDFARELERELAQRTAEVAEAEAERDEARREVCELLARSMKGPMEIAADRGWDCFDANLCGADGGIGTRR